MFGNLTFLQNRAKQKVPQGCSPPDLPILAKSEREWGPENAGSLTPFGMTFNQKLTSPLNNGLDAAPC